MGILFAKDSALYRKWVSTLRSIKSPPPSSLVTSKSPSSRDVLDPTLRTKVRMKQGDVFKEWMRAQQEMKEGNQPTVCMMNEVRLKRIGKIHRRATTVKDLQ